MKLARKIILLVEDNPDDQLLIARELKKNQIENEIVVLHDGEEALEYLLGTGAQAGRDLQILPQVVLLDLKLPKVGGFDVLRRIRADERTKLLPVVILTSSDEEEDIAECYRCGANSYVQKPVEFEQFRHAVRKLGLYWILVNRPPP